MRKESNDTEKLQSVGESETKTECEDTTPVIISRKAAQTLGLTRYYNGRLCKHGHRAERLVCNHVCYECVLETSRKRVRTEQHRKKKRKWDKARYNWQQPMNIWKNCKNRATKRGIAFEIEPEDVVIPDVCPVLGIKLHVGKRGFDPNSPSVDRIDPSKGYTKDNIEVVSMRVNKLKGDATLEELELIFNYTKNRLLGFTGEADHLVFNHQTGRLVPLQMEY